MTSGSVHLPGAWLSAASSSQPVWFSPDRGTVITCAFTVPGAHVCM